MNMGRMISLNQSPRFFLRNSSRQPNGTALAVDLEEAAPAQTPSGLGTGFSSAIRSSFASVSRGRTRLSSTIGLALGLAHRSQVLPITRDRPGPFRPLPPLPPLQPEPTTFTASDNIGKVFLPQAPAMALQRPCCQLHHHGNLQAGNSGPNTLPLWHPTSGQSQRQPTRPVYLGDTILGLSYQAALALLIFHLQGTSNSKNSSAAELPHELLLMAAEVTVVVGFAASLIGVLLREDYLKVAVVIETMGSAAAAAGFFLMVGMLFSASISKWVGGLCGVASLAAFMLPIIKKKWGWKF